MPRATPPPAGPADSVLCPRCSEGFECGVNTGNCWCASVTVDAAVRENLAGFYNGCLCPACLQEIEDHRPARQGVWAFLKKNLKRPRAA